MIFAVVNQCSVVFIIELIFLLAEFVLGIPVLLSLVGYLVELIVEAGEGIGSLFLAFLDCINLGLESVDFLEDLGEWSSAFLDMLGLFVNSVFDGVSLFNVRD